MSAILLVSLAIRLAALGWCLVVWRRVRDWRMAIVTLTVALLTVRQALTLYGASSAWPVTGVPAADEISGLLVAIGVLIIVILVGRMVADWDSAGTELAAANQRLRGEIVAREQAQDRLRESERMLATLMRNLPGMVYRCRNDRDWTVEFVSEGCLLLTGYEAADLVSRKVDYAQTIHSDDRERVWREVQAALAESRPFQVTYRIRTAAGDMKWVWEQGCGVIAADGKQYLEGFVTDVTERKIVEDKLRQAQKMEAVGHLTGGVAHDFNNLLAIIIGNLELAAEAGEPGTELHDQVTRALSAAERGADLTRQLLAFSRKQILQPQLLGLNKLVPRAVELLQRALGEHIEIETVLAGGLWKTMADPIQLEHALLNLALNARDAMPKGGRLTIETSNTRLDEDYQQLNYYARPGHYVLLAATDTGFGMPPEVAARAFDPFFTTKEVGQGSGLGLSMVYGFVKQTGGHIKIYSEVGQGTTVKLYFPRARDQATPVLEPSVEPLGEGTGSEIILLVEDDPEVRRLSNETLGDLGYGVIEAADGQAALAILRKTPDIDLLFTDIVLPGGMDGVALAAEARKLSPAIKVLFTTGYSYNAAVRNGGFNEDIEILAKPYRKAELARKIRQVLGKGNGNGG